MSGREKVLGQRNWQWRAQWRRLRNITCDSPVVRLVTAISSRGIDKRFHPGFSKAPLQKLDRAIRGEETRSVGEREDAGQAIQESPIQKRASEPFLKNEIDQFFFLHSHCKKQGCDGSC